MYTEFRFKSFDIDTEKGTITFHYFLDGEPFFTPELKLDLSTVNDSSDIESAVFLLGMTELPHFWKSVVTPKIVIEAGDLTSDQLEFWDRSYTGMMGEFFFKNSIDFRDLFTIEVDPNARAIKPSSLNPGNIQALVPFGGGKDSFTTGEILKEHNVSFSWFALTRGFEIEDVYSVSGVNILETIERPVEMYFKKVIEINKQGGPNGHVSITATYMASSVLMALVKGYSEIVFSIERSASEGNREYLGVEINHQYSKSYEFEEGMRDYINKHVSPDINLFSMLRDKYELQVIEKFAQHPQYHKTFVSCNHGLKNRTWCGECAKCAFVFSGLSAFMSPKKVIDIFGSNLYEKELMLPMYKDLIGQGDMKPFDCSWYL